MAYSMAILNLPGKESGEDKHISLNFRLIKEEESQKSHT